MSPGIFRDKDLFTPEAWYIYRTPDAKVSALQRSAMCVDAGSVGLKTALIRGSCQNIYTPPEGTHFFDFYLDLSYNTYNINQI